MLNFKYTGQEFDQESELYYYHARYYNPITGRFISLDPILGRDGNSLTRNGYVYVVNNPVLYIDPNGNVNWNVLGEGFKQTVFGSLTTAFGVAEISAGVALATGGTATGIGAIPGIAAGVVVGALGVNNVVAGGTQVSGGLVNIWNAFQDKEEVVDNTFNPAHEVIDVVTEKGTTGNIVAHVGYDVVDVIAGGVGVAKAAQGVAGTKRIIDTENVLLKVTGGAKTDVSLLTKSGSFRLHFGYDPQNLWHIGVGEVSKTWAHISGKAVLGTAAALRGINSYVNYSDGSDDNK